MNCDQDIQLFLEETEIWTKDFLCHLEDLRHDMCEHGVIYQPGIMQKLSILYGKAPTGVKLSELYKVIQNKHTFENKCLRYALMLITSLFIYNLLRINGRIS